MCADLKFGIPTITVPAATCTIECEQSLCAQIILNFPDDIGDILSQPCSYALIIADRGSLASWDGGYAARTCGLLGPEDEGDVNTNICRGL